MENNKVGKLIRLAVDAEGARLLDQFREGLLSRSEVEVALKAYERGALAALGVVAGALVDR